IAAAAADSATHWQALFQLNIYPDICTAIGLQQACSPDNEVLVKGDFGHDRAERDLLVVPSLKCNGVAVVKQLKQRLQIVVTIRPAAGDMEKQVQLGRGQQSDGIRGAHR